MVFFKCFKQGTVTILEDPTDTQNEGTTLTSYCALIGPRALGEFPHDNSLHPSRWTPMASRQLATFQQSNPVSTKARSDVLLLRSSNHDQSSPQDPFALLSDRVCNRSVQWNSTFRACGEFSYTEFYWEWLEDVLNRSSDRIRDAGLYKAVYASLFSYDRVAPVIRAFCEYWCPATNTLHTSQGEMSISL